MAIVGYLATVAYLSPCAQVPPTIFWPFDGPVEYSADGERVTVAAWNYQCPQCKHQGALLDASGRHHFDPWCDDVVCGAGPPAPPTTQDFSGQEEDRGWYGFGT